MMGTVDSSTDWDGTQDLGSRKHQACAVRIGLTLGYHRWRLGCYKIKVTLLIRVGGFYGLEAMLSRFRLKGSRIRKKVMGDTGETRINREQRITG